MFKLLMLAIGGFVALSSYASDFYDNFYQKCDDENKDFTNQVIQTARSYCTPSGNDWPQCIEPKKRESLAHCDENNLKVPDLIDFLKQCQWYHNGQLSEYNIPPICFLASTAWGLNQWKNNPRYYQCDDNNLNPKDTGKPPCSSKPYIQTIAKAFNEVANCFDFTKEEKIMAFGLAHHESRFKINKIEESDPEKKTHRCFGQIDNKFIATLNQYIHFGDRNLEGTNKPYDSNFFEYGDIYKEAIKKCPFLEKSLTPHPDKLKGTYLNINEENTFMNAHLKNQQNFDTMICKTSKDPYSCSFYTLYNIKATEERLKQYLLDNPQLNSLEIEEDGYDCKIVGEVSCIKKGRDFCKEQGIADCREIEKRMCQFIGDRSCKIFDEDHFYFKWAFTPWTHNAGFDGIVIQDFKRFTKYLRGKINNPNVDCKEFCKEGSANKKTQECQYCSYRNDILNRKPLRGEILIEEFQRYARNPSHNVSNYKQVQDIIDNMKDNLAELNQLTEESAKDFPKHIGAVKEAIEKLPNEYNSNNNDKRIGIMRADLDDFLINVSRQCPTEFPNYEN